MTIVFKTQAIVADVFGCVDRFLASCRPDCLRLGLSYFDPVERIDDANELDVPLNFCITPQQAYAF